MIELAPTSLQYAETLRRVRESGDYDRSLRGRQARQVGFLGEILIRDYLLARCHDYKETRTTKHDALLDGHRVEVKTKERTVVPKAHYEVSIAAYNIDHQDVHAYLFVSLLNSRDYAPDDVRRLTRGFIVGVADERIIRQHGTHRDQGQIDPRNGFATPMECYNLRHDDLMPLDRFCERLATRAAS